MKIVNTNLLSVFKCLLFSCILFSCKENNKPDPSPNVIVILTDDQGTLDINCFGSTDLYTPNMDKLAQTGIMFTQAYAHAVCCPTRASLLTGRAPQRANVNSWTQNNAHAEEPGRNMFLDEITIAELLKENGYVTGIFGKWHLGSDINHGPLSQGFDEFYGFRAGFIDNYVHFFLHGKGHHDLWDNKTEVYERGKYFPDLITDKALSFIEKNRDTTFFMYLAFNIPHYPEESDGKFDQYYTGTPEPRKSYGEMVSTTDDRIGKVLDKLEELNLRNNTLILFMSDNGHSTEDYKIRRENHNSGLPVGTNYGANGGGGNTGKWRGAKGSFLEGGVRTPAIISYPGVVPQGESRDQIITIMDFLPTICELTGVGLPEQKLDGFSILPIISDNSAESNHKVLFFQWQDRWAVRDGNWKLIMNGWDTTGKFSDHPKKKRKMPSPYLAKLDDENPEEINYADEYPEIVERLSKLYESWANDVFEDASRHDTNND
ncbi:MAG: sulfatase-like hydrolase/transferase [Deltaproteobacteria bacterium]|nr:sulfatase-like hydrolase/transferase [Deltaproteobacteria bacterium]